MADIVQKLYMDNVTIILLSLYLSMMWSPSLPHNFSDGQLKLGMVFNSLMFTQVSMKIGLEPR